MKTIIRDSKSLKQTLKEESYDKIIFFSSKTKNQEVLRWSTVSSGYAGEQEGDQPVMSIRRSYYHDLTGKEITTLLKNIRNGVVSIEEDVVEIYKEPEKNRQIKEENIRIQISVSDFIEAFDDNLFDTNICVSELLDYVGVNDILIIDGDNVSCPSQPGKVMGTITKEKNFYNKIDKYGTICM